MRVHILFFLGFLMVGCGQVNMPKDVAEVYQTLPDEIDYNRDVKKILSDKCFFCHGPDAKKQKADLRLDIASFAHEKITESGLKAIRPGNVGRSELVHRILSDDPDYKMPTPESHLDLTPYEKAILIKWIDQGAEYKPHWAFVTPENSKPPRLNETGWAENEIDHFIFAPIEKKGLRPAKKADKETLIRRLSFDIRGISPSISEINAFLLSKDPNAYEKVVDDFLASKHFGERMAAYWLDVARFADSHGYLDDKHRDMSPWRDWVISAFNRNIPFDDFVTWQMAGDLLPNPTQEQILATGFNRNHKQNSEAGIIEEEFRVEYVTDRTNTLGTAMLALTMGCAKCHDHKYDPITQKDYYSMFAFFNSTFEKGSPNYGDDRVVPGPSLLLTTKEDERSISQLRKKIRSLEVMENQRLKALDEMQKAKGEKEISSSLASKIQAKLDFDVTIRKNTQTGSFVNAVNKEINADYRKAEFGMGVKGKSLRYNDETKVSFPATMIGYYERFDPFSISLWLKIPENYPLATVFYNSEHHRYGYQGYDLLLKDNRLNFRASHSYPHDAISVLTKEKVPMNVWNHIAISYNGSSRADGISIYLNGKKLLLNIEYDHLLKNIRQQYSIHKGPLVGFSFGEKVLDKSMPRGEIDEFQIFSDVLTDSEVTYLKSLKSIPIYRKKIKTDSLELLRVRKSLCDIYDSVKEVMVMGDLPKPRITYVLDRGVYDSPREKVEPSTPSAIFPFNSKYQKNRLGLSQWLFDAENPLTSRVAVNRIWQLIFGKGLVVTSDDFGNQGSLPTHPELLDYLSLWYQKKKWDTKALMKYIFMSASYQQSSVNENPFVVKADPDNNLLTRSPRYRFSAEMIRDNALSIAGLLSDKVGGPSVYPYQPPGLWEELSDKAWRYQYTVSEGEDLFRKSIYTVRKRTSVVPFLQIFDAPDRSLCTVKRQISSSPMQSLAMLNDPQIVESAKFLALRMMNEGGSSIEGKLRFGFRLITGRFPRKNELELMKQMYFTEQKQFENNALKTSKLLTVGNKKAEIEKPFALAGLTTTVLALMNTDEFLTRK